MFIKKYHARALYHLVTCFLLCLIMLLCALSPERAAAQPTIEPPALVEFVEAEFPESERETGEGATVLLQIAISEEGEVVGVALLESAGEAFDRAAVEAVRQFKFSPAKRDGVPIPVRIEYAYDFVIHEEEIEITTATIRGTVVDRGSGESVAGAVLELDDGERVITGEDGRFAFDDIEPGVRTITVSGDAIRAVSASEEVVAGERLEVVYEVSIEDEDDEENDLDFEFVVTAPRIRRQVIATEIAATEGRRVPGTQGDVLKVVENLPGVARSAAGSSALVVWGAAPEDTRTYIDGIHIPRLYHDGGFRSVIHSDMVRSVELIPGGYAPPYGRGIGGIVRVRQRPLDEDGFHGSVSADVIDVGASIRAKLGKKVHMAASFRRSHLDAVANLVSKDDVRDIIPIPRYYDGQLRLSYTIRENERLEIGGIASSDRIDRTVLHSDPALTSTDSRGMDFYRVYLRYDKQDEKIGNISFLQYYGQDRRRLLNRFGGVPTHIDNDSNIVGLRTSWSGKLHEKVALEVGVDAEILSANLSRGGAVGAPPREGDARVFGQAPADRIGSDEWSALIASAGVYASLGVNLWNDRLRILPGFRVEPYITRSSRATPAAGDSPGAGTQRYDLAIEPRLSVLLQAADWLGFKAAIGRYHQPPAAEDLSAVFGTPTLGPARSTHYLLGANFRMMEKLNLELNGFYTYSDKLVWRSVAEQPFLAQALTQDAVGRSYGGQALLRIEKIGPFFGWLSYTLSRSERKDAPGLDWRRFDYDQTHNLTALGAFDLGKGFEAGFRVRYSTGYPRTPVLGAYYDATSDIYQPIFGARNSIRIPAFVSLDIRGAKSFKIGEYIRGEVFLEVQNLMNRRNPEELIYNPTYTQHDYISGFPILSVFGARAEW